MSSSTKSKRKRGLQSEYYISLYKKEHGTDGLNPSSVADWVMGRGIYRPQPVDPARQLRQDLVRFLRAETVKDDNGNAIRKNHPVVMTDGERRFSVWEEITTARSNHMETSLLQRRNGIAADCRQHKLDFDYYNLHNVHGSQLKDFDYNFNPDIEEMSLPTEYPEDKP